jgi:hypothetical protein
MLPNEEVEDIQRPRARQRTKTVSLRNPNGSLDWKILPDGRVIIMDKLIQREPDETQETQ